jgi:multidrug resistance efflux pump
MPGMDPASIGIARPRRVGGVAASLKTLWQKYGTPGLIVLLALAIVLTLTRNWNAWEGRRIDQVINDAYLRRDVTPLSTKVAGLVRAVKVNDYQRVRGDELVQLEDDDYRAQIAQVERAASASGSPSTSSCQTWTSSRATAIRTTSRSWPRTSEPLEFV